MHNDSRSRVSWPGRSVPGSRGNGEAYAAAMHCHGALRRFRICSIGLSFPSPDLPPRTVSVALGWVRALPGFPVATPSRRRSPRRAKCVASRAWSKQSSPKRCASWTRLPLPKTLSLNPTSWTRRLLRQLGGGPEGATEGWGQEDDLQHQRLDSTLR